MQTRPFVFFDQHICPNERRLHEEIETNHRVGNARIPTKTIEELKPLAHKVGPWNLFLPRSSHAPEGLSNLEYVPLCEVMGHIPWAPEVFNCSASDTGDMETLERYAFEELKDRWLEPLLRGKIRPVFLMTEPTVASSGATSIECRIKRQGDEHVIDGRKWWSSGVGDPHHVVHIVMGKANPDVDYCEQQLMIAVSANTPGITVMRPSSVFGYDDAPHGRVEIDFKDMRVPMGSILLGGDRGFEIAQGCLSPGRVHHCMRNISVARRTLELMYKHLSSRIAFGKTIAQHSVWHKRIVEVRYMIEQAHLLTLKVAYMMDTVGNKVAKAEIVMIRVVVPNIVCQTVNWTIQTHDDGGVSGDFPLTSVYTYQRTLRLADGPDEVRRATIAKLGLAKHLHLKGVVDMSVTRGT